MADRFLVVAVAYLIGSVPVALILARQWGTPDLREVGSGNVGATNVARAHGLRRGILVALLDIAKGAVSVVLAERVSGGGAAAAAGIAAIIGHVFPVWIGFRGGKGVATACGVFSILAPLAALAAFVVFVVSVSFTRYVSLGSVLAAITLPPVTYATGSPVPAIAAAGAAALVIVATHRSNLTRLRAGTERRLSAGGASRVKGHDE